MHKCFFFCSIEEGKLYRNNSTNHLDYIVTFFFFLSRVCCVYSSHLNSSGLENTRNNYNAIGTTQHNTYVYKVIVFFFPPDKQLHFLVHFIKYIFFRFIQTQMCNNNSSCSKWSFKYVHSKFTCDFSECFGNTALNQFSNAI